MSGRHDDPAAPASGSDADLAREPERWSAARPDDDLHGKLGAAFRALAAASVPALPADLPEKLEGAAARRARGAARPRLAHGLATVALVVIVLGGALAGAKVYRNLRAAPAIARVDPSASGEIGRKRVRRPRGMGARTIGRGETSTADDTDAPETGLPGDTLGASPPQAIDGEATLLAGAFRSLRAQHDPAGALALLDAHDRQFPGGQLADEASLARVESLLALGRHREALGVLERGPSVDRARERALLRGELRAEAGRCASALADFGVAEREAPPEIATRAVWDQATCRARLGDTAGARRDFERYLATAPAGASARQARRWLTAHAPESTGAAPAPETFRP